MLTVERVDPPQPDQTHEQNHGPHDLHKEADLGKTTSSDAEPAVLKVYVRDDSQLPPLQILAQYL